MKVRETLELTPEAAKEKLDSEGVEEVRRQAHERMAAVDSRLREGLVKIKVVVNQRRNFVDFVLARRSLAMCHVERCEPGILCCFSPSDILEPFVVLCAIEESTGKWLVPPLTGSAASAVEQGISGFVKKFGISNESFVVPPRREPGEVEIDPILLKIRVASAMVADKLPIWQFVDMQRLRSNLDPVRSAFAAGTVPWHEARAALLSGDSTVPAQTPPPVVAAAPSDLVTEDLRAAASPLPVDRVDQAQRQAVDIIRRREPLLSMVSEVRVTPSGNIEAKFSSRFNKPLLWMTPCREGSHVRVVIYSSDKLEPFVVITVMDTSLGTKLQRLNRAHVEDIGRALGEFEKLVARHVEPGKPIIEGFHYTGLSERRETAAFHREGAHVTGTKAHSNCFHLKARISNAVLQRYVLLFRIFSIEKLMDSFEPVRYSFSGRKLMQWEEAKRMMLADATQT